MEGAQALFRIKQALLKKDQQDWSLPKDVLTMLAHPVREVPISYFDNEEDARAWLEPPRRIPHIQSA